jgi:hypothetical protein
MTWLEAQAFSVSWLLSGAKWRFPRWLTLGLLILAKSRPLEGLLAVLPAGDFFMHRLGLNRRWHAEVLLAIPLQKVNFNPN